MWCPNKPTFQSALAAIDATAYLHIWKPHSHLPSHLRGNTTGIIIERIKTVSSVSASIPETGWAALFDYCTLVYWYVRLHWAASVMHSLLLTSCGWPNSLFTQHLLQCGPPICMFPCVLYSCLCTRGLQVGWGSGAELTIHSCRYGWPPVKGLIQWSYALVVSTTRLSFILSSTNL